MMPSNSLRTEGRARLAPLLVQLPVEMQALEHELDGCGDRRGVAGAPELRDGALHPRDLERLLHVLARGEARRHVHRRAALEGREQRVELPQREGAVEDVEDGTLREA